MQLSKSSENLKGRDSRSNGLMAARRKNGENKPSGSGSPEQPEMSRWELLFLGVPWRRAHLILPGLALAAILWLAAEWLSGFIGLELMGFGTSPISAIMLAILLGMALRNSVGLPQIFEPGVRFTLVKVLRLGIILLGVRLSLLAAAQIGFWGLPVIAACIIAGLVFTIQMAKKLKLSPGLGTLIAVGTSICGATAIVATGPTIQAKEEEVAYAVACITIFGIAAMLLYPLMAPHLFSSDAQVGFFLGTSIHETAQVAGAGLIYDQLHPGTVPNVADVSITTKLVRNICMSIVIPAMAILYARRQARQENVDGGVNVAGRVSPLSVFPLFILGFIAAIILRTAGDAGLAGGGLALGFMDAAAWGELVGTAGTAAKSLLAVAMAGVGLGCDFGKLRYLGIKPFIVGIVAALVVGLTSFVVLILLGSHIAII